MLFYDPPITYCDSSTIAVCTDGSLKIYCHCGCGLSSVVCSMLVQIFKYDFSSSIASIYLILEASDIGEVHTPVHCQVHIIAVVDVC